MSNKIVCFFGLVVGLWIFSLNGKTFSKEDCPFCKPSVLDSQKFYEDDLVLALYSYKPIMPGHCLVIPRKHIERFELLSDAEAMRICQVIQKVDRAAAKAFGTSSYLLLQKNGHEAGQTVPHVHFHYIPRKKGDDSILKFLFKMFFVNAKRPIQPSEMQEAVEKMKAAIESKESG